MVFLPILPSPTENKFHKSQFKRTIGVGSLEKTHITSMSTPVQINHLYEITTLNFTQKNLTKKKT